MGDKDQAQGIDALREELKRLGYLDSRWERFFLADLGERVSFLSANLKTSLRLGLSGGVLVAILLVLSTLQAAPELAREPVDLLVLGLYFTLASAFVVAVVALATGLVVNVLHRVGALPRVRIEPLARGFGVFLGLLSLTYLCLWWRSHVPPGREWGAASLMLLALCVMVGLALGRFGTLALLGVLARTAPLDDLRGPLLPRKKTVPLAVIGGVLYVALFLVLTRRPGAAEVLPPSPYRVAPSPLRVRFIGIDGLTLEMIDLMRAGAAAPGFEALARRGTTVPLAALSDRVPSLVWTSIATGQVPAAHGVRAMTAERMPGLKTPLQLGEGRTLGSALAAMGSVFRVSEARPVSTSLRRAKAVWDVLSDEGSTVGVIGWWATWPADPVQGFLLSDRLFFKLKNGGAFDRETDAPELFGRLQSSFESDRRDAIRMLGALREEAGPEIGLALERDAYHILVGERLRAEQEPGLSMLYLPSLDVASMKLLRESPRELSRLARGVHLVEGMARFFDGIVGRALDDLEADDVLVVVAEPGRLAPAGTQGVLYLAGGAFHGGIQASQASYYDVTPTLLYLLGFPSSQEMPGVVLDAVRLPSRAPERIATFGSRKPELPSAVPTAGDREMLEQLRSLGYVQ